MTTDSGSMLATIRIKRSQWERFKDYATRRGSNASALLIAYILDCVDRDWVSSDDVYSYSQDNPPSSKDKTSVIVSKDQLESSAHLFPDSLPEIWSDATNADSEREALATSASFTAQAFIDAQIQAAIEPTQKLLEVVCLEVDAMEVEIEASYHQVDDALNELEAKWESRFAQLEAANEELAQRNQYLMEKLTELLNRDTRQHVEDSVTSSPVVTTPIVTDSEPDVGGGTLINTFKQGLNQNELANRLKRHPITIYRQAERSKDGSKFAAWSKNKDPNGIAWRRGNNGRYYPIDN